MSSLYYHANFEKYKEGKINILSSKTNVLKSREIVKKLVELRTEEDDIRKSIIKNVSSIKYNLKKFADEIPKMEKPKEINPNVLDDKETKTTKKTKKKEKKSSKDKKKVEKIEKSKSEIETELDLINQKLAELQTL